MLSTALRSAKPGRAARRTFPCLPFSQGRPKSLIYRIPGCSGELYPANREASQPRRPNLAVAMKFRIPPIRTGSEVAGPPLPTAQGRSRFRFSVRRTTPPDRHPTSPSGLAVHGASGDRFRGLKSNSGGPPAPPGAKFLELCPASRPRHLLPLLLSPKKRRGAFFFGSGKCTRPLRDGESTKRYCCAGQGQMA